MLGHHLRHFHDRSVVSTQRGRSGYQIPGGQSALRGGAAFRTMLPRGVCHLSGHTSESAEKTRNNNRHVQKNRPPLATSARRCAREQPLSPETGPLQSRKCQPSPSEEKRRTTCGQRAPYRALCGEHEGKTAPACPAPSVHERRFTRALVGSSQLQCRPIGTLDSASSPRGKGQHTRSTAGGLWHRKNGVASTASRRRLLEWDHRRRLWG